MSKIIFKDILIMIDMTTLISINKEIMNNHLIIPLKIVLKNVTKMTNVSVLLSLKKQLRVGLLLGNAFSKINQLVQMGVSFKKTQTELCLFKNASKVKEMFHTNIFLDMKFSKKNIKIEFKKEFISNRKLIL